ncbi:MAG: hypothetical protein ABSD67_17665 [Terracidiphilus sp.]|jgi:hypothetical protein
MRTLILGSVLLVSACILPSTAAAQQRDFVKTRQSVSTDVAVSFTLERADVVPTQCCFWLKGGGADVAITFWKGLGLAATVNGDQVTNYASGYDVNKIAFLAGPRYTHSLWAAPTRDGGYKNRIQVYGDGLIGEVHAFDGTFPSGTAFKSSAGSVALQTGGGVNMPLSRRFGIRLIEADYVRTVLPNGSANVQNDMRFGFGVTYHLGPGPRP